MPAPALTAAGGQGQAARGGRGRRATIATQTRKPALDRPLGEAQALPAEHREPEVAGLVLLDGGRRGVPLRVVDLDVEPAVGVGEIEVRPCGRSGSTTGCCWIGRRQAGGDERLLERRARARTSSAVPSRSVRSAQPLPRGRASAAPAAQVVVHLAELGVRAQPLVADVLDHREVPRSIEHPTEVEDRPGHRRDAGAVDELDDVVIRHAVAVVHDGACGRATVRAVRAP